MSRLRTRLATLKQQTGQNKISHTSVPPTGDLQERLSRVGRIRKKNPAKLSAQQLADLLGGKNVEKGLIIVEKIIPAGTDHGNKTLFVEPQHIQFFGYPADSDLLFMDTETTGLAGGSGTVIFLLGLARFADNKLTLRQYLLTEFSGETAMLNHAREFVDGTQIMVSYNGKGFDQPLLQTRCRMTGCEEFFAQLLHCDLLYLVRRAFSRHWADCRLRTLEQNLLGFTRHNDLPGEQVPEAWFRWLRNGDHNQLPRVLRHNYWDLLSLAVAVPALVSCYKQPQQFRSAASAAAKLYLEQNQPQLAYRHLQQHQQILHSDEQLLLARLAMQFSHPELAINLWRQLARQDNRQALLQLAKFYEHQDKNFQRALHCTQRLSHLEQHKYEHQHRAKRLQRKLAALVSAT